jgi:hypothetical protein
MQKVEETSSAVVLQLRYLGLLGGEIRSRRLAAARTPSTPLIRRLANSLRQLIGSTSARPFPCSLS